MPCCGRRDLQAYYQMKYFGIDARGAGGRRHHAPRRPQRDLRPRRRIRARGKTSFIKTIAARHPAAAQRRRRLGALQLPRPRHLSSSSREALAAIRWKHLSYIMQGSMNVLNPVRRVRQSFVDFAFRHIGRPSRSSSSIVEAHLRAAASRAARARRLSARAVRRHAPARHDRARHHLPARLHHRRRADHRARRRRAEGRAGDDPRGAARDRLVDPLRHPRHGGACQPGRPARHHVCRPPGRGGADAPISSAARCIPTPRT